MRPTLIVVTGATGVGKTAAALTRLLNDSEAVSARLRARVCELSRLAEADLDHAAALIKKSGAALAEKS